MNAVANKINTLIGLFDRDVTTLERIVEENPASTLARVVLLKKYKELNHSNYKKLREESALFVPNLPWYLYLLSTFDIGQNVDEAPQQTLVNQANPEEVVLSEESEAGGLEELISKSGNGSMTDYKHETSNERNNEDAEKAPSFPEKVISELQEESFPGKADQDSSVHTFQDGGEVASTHISTEEPFESGHEAEGDFIIASDETGKENPDLDADDLADKGESQNQAVEHQIVNSNSTEGQPSRESIEEVKETETSVETGSERGSNMPEGIAETDTEKAGSQKATIDFEPLHTIDYFASQGIRLSEEDLRDDRLSQQVKSFTGWLKSMKKLHPGKLPEQNEVIEKIIQNAAESSNVEKDVLTEAMAEVLVKQNKKDKAVEMYQKLSLINPSKSAYFAAKIENLKTT